MISDELKELLAYMDKLKRVVDTKSIKFRGTVYIKKDLIDDIIVCMDSLLPREFRSAENQFKYKTWKKYKAFVLSLRVKFSCWGKLYKFDYREFASELKDLRRLIPIELNMIRSRE